MNKEPNF